MTLATFFDGSDTPTYLQANTDPRRPGREDVSWRVEDWDTHELVESYHPAKPRHITTRTEAPCQH